jgi:hypothetical protein
MSLAEEKAFLARFATAAGVGKLGILLASCLHTGARTNMMLAGSTS